MENAVRETKRRRELQMAYNREHNITPQTVKKKIHDLLVEKEKELEVEVKTEDFEHLAADDLRRLMKEAAEKLDFERAAKIRDLIAERERDK
jgi:excinuclease ABC subunit B